MATITLAPAGTGHYSRQFSNVPYTVEYEIDFAVAAEEKGSALAAADVIEAIRVPAGTVCQWATLEVKTVAAGESSDTAVTLGDGADTDRYATTFDLDAAAAGAYGAIVAANVPFLYASADTIDLTISAATTAPTGGVVRVIACLVDVADHAAPGIAQVGS